MNDGAFERGQLGLPFQPCALGAQCLDIEQLNYKVFPGEFNMGTTIKEFL